MLPENESALNRLWKSGTCITTRPGACSRKWSSPSPKKWPTGGVAQSFLGATGVLASATSVHASVGY